MNSGPNPADADGLPRAGVEPRAGAGAGAGEVVAALRRARAVLTLDEVEVSSGAGLATTVPADGDDEPGEAGGETDPTLRAAGAEGLAELLEVLEGLLDVPAVGLVEPRDLGEPYAADLSDLRRHLRAAIASARALTGRPAS